MREVKKQFVHIFLVACVALQLFGGLAVAQESTESASATESAVTYTSTTTSTTSGQVTLPTTLPESGRGDGVFLLAIGLFLLCAAVVTRATLLATLREQNV